MVKIIGLLPHMISLIPAYTYKAMISVWKEGFLQTYSKVTYMFRQGILAVSTLNVLESASVW